MTTTANTELRDFQRQVKAAAEQFRGVAYGAGSYVDQFLSSIGLDSFVDDHQITVKVTVPAATVEEATSQVQSQLGSVYLPSGWTAEVSA